MELSNQNQWEYYCQFECYMLYFKPETTVVADYTSHGNNEAFMT